MHDVLASSRSDRWQTPPELLAAITQFFGAPPLDPCPLTLPGTPLSSGLWCAWAGRVYCNPPYGRAIGPWITKALTEPVEELLLLVPARTDTAWFAPLFAYPICFLRGRLHFSGAAHAAPFPSALVYRGAREARFATAFQARGTIVRALPLLQGAPSLFGAPTQAT